MQKLSGLPVLPQLCTARSYLLLQQGQVCQFVGYFVSLAFELSLPLKPQHVTPGMTGAEALYPIVPASLLLDSGCSHTPMSAAYARRVHPMWAL